MIYLRPLILENENSSNIKRNFDIFEDRFSSYLDRLIYFLDARKFHAISGIKSDTWNHSYGYAYDFLEDNINRLKKLTDDEYDDLFSNGKFLHSIIDFFWFYDDDILNDKIIGDRDENSEKRENVELFFVYMLINRSVGCDTINIDFNTDIISKENQKLKSFYTSHYSSAFSKILNNLYSVWHQHGLHNNTFEKFISTDMKMFPQFTNWNKNQLCVETDTLLNNSNVFGFENIEDDARGNKGTSYYRTIAGIILDSDLRKHSTSIKSDRDHLVFDNINIPVEDWVFLYNSKTDFLQKYYSDLFKANIVPLDKNILHKIVLLNNLLYSKLKMYFVK